MQEMCARLSRIERNMRTWRRCTCVIALVLLLALLARETRRTKVLAGEESDRKTDVITAKRLEVINKKGQVVWSVFTDNAGHGVHELKYGNGKTIFTARAGDFEMAALAVYSRRGKPSAILREGFQGGGVLEIISRKMQPVVQVISDENDEGGIILLSHDAKKMKRITVSEQDAVIPTDEKLILEPTMGPPEE